jgi:hypothetical protein
MVYIKKDMLFQRGPGWSVFLKLHEELKKLGKIDQVWIFLYLNLPVSYLKDLEVFFRNLVSDFKWEET